MLEVQNLTKRYNKTLAVDNVSFTVNTGRIGILLGPNGAGKSTVIKSIAGLLKYEGGVGINGLPARTTEAKKIFGYVPELPALFPNLTVAEHLEYIRRAYDVSVSDEEVEKLLDSVRITCNKNAIANDPKPASVTSGIRLGTPAVTTRGMKEDDMELIAEAIRLAVLADEPEKAVAIVDGLVKKYPLYE